VKAPFNPNEAAKRFRENLAQARIVSQRAAQHYMAAGDDLRKAKANLPYGEWQSLGPHVLRHQPEERASLHGSCGEAGGDRARVFGYYLLLDPLGAERSRRNAARCAPPPSAQTNAERCVSRLIRFVANTVAILSDEDADALFDELAKMLETSDTRNATCKRGQDHDGLGEQTNEKRSWLLFSR
jgi:hypothetical protein